MWMNTDRHEVANSSFSQFANKLENCATLWKRPEYNKSFTAPHIIPTHNNQFQWGMWDWTLK